MIAAVKKRANIYHDALDFGVDWRETIQRFQATMNEEENKTSPFQSPDTTVKTPPKTGTTGIYPSKTIVLCYSLIKSTRIFM